MSALSAILLPLKKIHLLKKLAYDPANLDVTVPKQAKYLREAAELKALFTYKLEQAKLTLRSTEAATANRVRGDASLGKLTKDAVDDLVAVDPVVIEAKGEVLVAEYQEEMMKGLQEAWRERGKKLDNSVEIFKQMVRG